jgi:hypothetical protein
MRLQSAAPSVDRTIADIMADPIAQLREIDEKHSNESEEKLSLDSNGKPIDDAELVKEVEALEERIELDEATEDEYRVGEAYEVALKVRISFFILLFSKHTCHPLGIVHQGRPLAPVTHFSDFLPRSWLLRLRSVSLSIYPRLAETYVIRKVF